MEKAVNKREFRKIVQDYFKASTAAGKLIDSVFDAFDTDKSGTVEFKEFMEGLGMLATGYPPPEPGTPAATKMYEEKVAFFFSMWDVDNSGEIDKDELLQHFNKHHDQSFKRIDALIKKWEEFDVDGDGKIGYEEFKKAAVVDDSAMQTFAEIFHKDTRTDITLAEIDGQA